MGTKVVDYAGKICSRSEQWGMTTFKCLISAYLYTYLRQGPNTTSIQGERLVVTDM